MRAVDGDNSFASDPTLATATAFNAAAIAAASAATPASFLNDALSQLGRLLDVPACSVLIYSDDGLKCAAASGLPASYLDGPDWEILPEGFYSRWLVPLELEDGRRLGHFVAYRHDPGEPSGHAFELAAAYASVLALGLDRIRQQALLAARYQGVVVALTAALDARDEYAGGHSSETSDLARRVALRLGMDPAGRELVAQVAVLHDIGKLGIPTDVLLKDGPLEPDERALMRQHPVIGERILSGIPGLGEVATAIRHEHERWDGHGYPDGLAGEQIPLVSRIVFACDAWHAMTSDRPYRPAMDSVDAMRELRGAAGAQFDPRVAQALLEILGDHEGPPTAVAPPEAFDQSLSRDLAKLAERLGADDVLVFRRVTGSLYSHIGGIGRGVGWAGNIKLDSSEDARLQAAIADGAPVHITLEPAGRIIGPYYARSAVIVPCSDESVVIFGSPQGTVDGENDQLVAELAERVRALVVDVTPAKRLADELEVLAAVREVTTVNAESIVGTLSSIALRARKALSGEFVAVATMPSDGSQPVIGVSAGRWEPRDPEATAEAIARFSADPEALPFLSQDVSLLDDPPRCFADRDGVSSMHVLPIGSPVVAMLFAVHAEPGLRGFTDLCQRVAHAISDAAEPIVRRAMIQDELEAENERLSERVRTDALTGVSSRSAWDEALRSYARDQCAPPVPLSVVIVDIDGLKAVNDEAGHAAGDDLLRRCANVLADAAGRNDLVARIGGDEFGVLLRQADEERARGWCERVTELLHQSDGVATRWSLGSASVPPQESVAAAVTLADRRMYEYKLRGRSQRP